ncbi:LuxR family transcriptional regulator [Allokutzneria sp. NRRL B-24872]|uniref:helix-turn-helix transcriptional regulator n=1 Tax=Allokutzneria sp. NRRL B-24872 TaxID=1137961 RepID=UPI000A37430C|nr:LuxR family transcriptional regulator [Allokutzneria sp. NRRL B-24872]
MTSTGERSVGTTTRARELIGRAAELAELSSLASSAVSGEVGIALVRGTAGMGKTTLLDEFSRAVAVSGEVRLLRVSCQEHAECFSTARALVGLECPGAEPEVLSYRVFQDLYRRLAELAAASPLALVIDDAHQCDEASMHWLEFLLRRATDLPLLLVLAQRVDTPGPGTSGLTWLAAHSRCSVLELGPFGYGEIAEFAERALLDTPDTCFVDGCAEITGGNPLVLGRLLDELSREGVLPDATGAVRAEQLGEQVLAASALAQLASRPEHVRAVAEAVAVLGETAEDVPTGLTAALAGVQPGVVVSALEELSRIGVTVPGEAGYAHPVIRGAVLARLDEARLRQLRTRAGRLLSDAGRPAEEVAEQLRGLSGDLERWMVDIFRAAAARAETRGAYDVAVRYLTTVLQSLGDNESERARARVALAGPLAKIDPDAALDQLRRALAATTPLRERAEIAVRFGQTAVLAQGALDGVKVLGAVADELAENRRGEAIGELLALVESTLLVCGSTEQDSIALVRERARRIELPEGRTATERQTLAMTALLAASEAREPASHAVSLARRALRGAGVSTESRACYSAAIALSFADEVAESLSTMDALVVACRDKAERWTLALATATRALMLHTAGDVTGSLADATTATLVAGEQPSHDVSCLPNTALAAALVERGELDRAEALLDAVQTARFEGFIWEWPHYLQTRARLARARGDLDGALRHLEHCGVVLADAGITNPVLTRWWVDAACLHADKKQPAKARELVEQASEVARRWGTPRAKGLALVARGVLEKGKRSLELLEEAVEVLPDDIARLDVAFAEYRLGAQLLREDDSPAARSHLRRALDMATRCGATALGAAAGKLHADAGGRLHRHIASPVDTLTGSERRVAMLAMAGGSNREIGDALRITVRTVEVHLTNVYRKLGVAGRAELAPVLDSVRSAHDPGQ